jgi:hypothetical protein
MVASAEFDPVIVDATFSIDRLRELLAGRGTTTIPSSIIAVCAVAAPRHERGSASAQLSRSASVGSTASARYVGTTHAMKHTTVISSAYPASARN